MSESIVAETEATIKAATHLTDMDKGAVAVLLVLARKIDENGICPECDAEIGVMDNTSLPTYLKYCDALGLTPSARLRLGKKPAQEPPETELDKLRAGVRSAA